MAQEPKQEDKDAGQDKKGKSGWPAKLGRALRDNTALIAALLALAGVIITQIVTSCIADTNLATQRELEEQRAREAELQTYFDDMGDMLLNENSPLAEAELDDPIRSLARAKTLTILERLDGQPTSKRNVLQFLYESRLVRSDEPIFPIVPLAGADLSDADLSDAVLVGAHLRGADLSDADLWIADLSDANLSKASLDDADLSGATGITNEELAQQDLYLEETTMPDGQKYEDWFKIAGSR